MIIGARRRGCAAIRPFFECLRRDLELFEGCDTDENRRDRLMRNDIA
jgi:hypothetical protein